jgi:hypothetical protein
MYNLASSLSYWWLQSRFPLHVAEVVDETPLNCTAICQNSLRRVRSLFNNYLDTNKYAAFLIMEEKIHPTLTVSCASKPSAEGYMIYVLFTCSSVSVETRLRAGRAEFNSPQGQWWDFFSLRYRVQIGSRANPASYPMRTGGGARGWSLTSI